MAKPKRPAETDAALPAPCALLLIDVINDLEFDGGEKLLPRALPMARKLAALVKRARLAHVPVVYSAFFSTALETGARVDFPALKRLQRGRRSMRNVTHGP